MAYWVLASRIHHSGLRLPIAKPTNDAGRPSKANFPHGLYWILLPHAAACVRQSERDADLPDHTAATHRLNVVSLKQKSQRFLNTAQRYRALGHSPDATASMEADTRSQRHIALPVWVLQNRSTVKTAEISAARCDFRHSGLGAKVSLQRDVRFQRF